MTFARGGSAMFASFVAQAVLQFVLVLVVGHLLGAGSAGAFLESIALFMIATQLGTFGADSGIVRAVPLLRAQARSGEVRTSVVAAVTPVAVAGTAAGVAVFAAAGLLAGAFFDPAHRDAGTTAFRVMAVFIPVSACSTVAFAALRGLGRTAWFAAQNAAVAAARPLLVASVAVIGLGPGAVALAWSLPLLPAGIAAAYLLRRELHRYGRTGPPGPPPAWRQTFWQLWTYSLPRALASGFTITITWLDVLLVGRLASTTAAGVYGIASRLYVVGSYALQAVGVAAAPQFSELLAAGRSRELERVYQVGTCWTMALSWPFYAVMLVFPETMVRTLFGADYADGGRALAILGVAGLIDIGTGNSQALLLMSGYSKLYALNTGVALVLNVGLNLALIPSLGISGAAIAWAVSIATTNLAAVAECRLLLGMRPFGPGYRFAAGAALACFLALPAAVRLVAGTGVPVFLVTIAVALAVYVSLLHRFRRVLDLPVLWWALRGRRPSRPSPA